MKRLCDLIHTATDTCHGIVDFGFTCETTVTGQHTSDSVEAVLVEAALLVEEMRLIGPWLELGQRVLGELQGEGDGLGIG